VVSDIANADDAETRVREWLAHEPAGE
jgi:hypothetical protein